MKEPDLFPPRRHRFSLIELLITVAVIAILAGLLLPALNRAREKARALNCLSNLKQTGMAAISYAGDNEDCLLPARYRRDAANCYWPGLLQMLKYCSSKSYICPEGEAALYANATEDRVSKALHWRDGRINSAGDATVAWEVGTFGINLVIAYDFDQNSAPTIQRLTQLKRPSAVLAFADSAHKIDLTPCFTVRRNAAQAHFAYPRHLGQRICNLVYMDGHAGSVRATVPGKAGAEQLYAVGGELAQNTTVWTGK